MEGKGEREGTEGIRKKERGGRGKGEGGESVPLALVLQFDHCFLLKKTYKKLGKTHGRRWTQDTEKCTGLEMTGSGRKNKRQSTLQRCDT